MFGINLAGQRRWPVVIGAGLGRVAIAVDAWRLGPCGDVDHSGNRRRNRDPQRGRRGLHGRQSRHARHRAAEHRLGRGGGGGQRRPRGAGPRRPAVVGCGKGPGARLHADREDSLRHLRASQREGHLAHVQAARRHLRRQYLELERGRRPRPAHQGGAPRGCRQHARRAPRLDAGLEGSRPDAEVQDGHDDAGSDRDGEAGRGLHRLRAVFARAGAVRSPC